MITQARGDGGLHCRSSSGIRDKWTDSTNTQLVKLTGLGSRPHMGHERRRRTKDDLEIYSMVRWVGG